MKRMAAILSLILLMLFITGTAYSHRPVIVKNKSSREKPVIVEEPEISWAYYGILKGNPHYYKIVSSEPFNLYVNILVPDYDPQGEPIELHDMSFEVIEQNRVLFYAEGLSSQWRRYYEKYGRDHYDWGPEYDENVGAGTYYVKVFNRENKGKYSLAIGKIEKFTFPVFLSAMIRAQSLDRWFFKNKE